MGRIVAGQYELISMIGRGPTGTVWRAKHGGTREDFAVKLLHHQFAADPVVVDKFEREQHVLSALVHRNLLRVRDLVVDGPNVGLATELVEGPDLRQEIRAAGSLGERAAVAIAAQCAEALAAAHAVGVVHCDVKPANVLLAKPGEVRLTDCRVARLARGHRDSLGRFGNPRYAAPEVISGGPPVAATDVYGLGLVLYEALLGVPRCAGEDPVEVLHQHLEGRPVVSRKIRARLRDLLEAALAVDPQARPSADALADGLRGLPRTTTAPPTPPGSPTHRPPDTYNQPRRAEPLPHVRAVIPAGGRPEPRRRRPGRAAAGLDRRLRAVLAGAIAALLLSLAGMFLSSEQDPRGPTGAPATVNPVASTHLSSERSGPRLSAAASAPTADGAVAFAHFWFDALNYALRTGRTGPLSAASSPACRACAVAAQRILKEYGDGRRLRGGGYMVRFAQATNFFSLAQPSVGIVYDRSDYSIVGPDGNEVHTEPGLTFASCDVLLEWADDRWRMHEVFGRHQLV